MTNHRVLVIACGVVLLGVASWVSSTCSPLRVDWFGVSHGTVRAADSCPTYRHLLLIYPNTDVDYVKDGITHRYTGTMSDSLKATIETAFASLTGLVTDGSAGVASSTSQVIEVSRPVTHISPIGDDKYWLSDVDVGGDLQLYAPVGVFDSVHVVWNNGPIDAYFGLGGIFVNNGTATFSSLIAGQDFFWTGARIGEPFLHEWLHGVCRFYANLGYIMPDGDADGAGSHGYVHSDTDGWMGYYRDLMQGQVWEPRLSRYTGITEEAWHRGTPFQPCCQTLTLSPISLADGTVGTAYSQTITATGGTPPYRFALANGAVPPGLALTVAGTLSGTPTATGTFHFAVTATDSAGCIGTQSYTVTIEGGCSVSCGAQVPLTGVLGELTDFIASVSSDCVGLPTYDWDFGDGSVHSSFQNPTHTYNGEGRYAWVLAIRIRGEDVCNTSGSITISRTCIPPSIVTQPINQTIASGQSVTLSVTAAGTAPLHYQWYRGISGDTSDPISGAVSDSYATPPLPATSRFWVRVSNECGSTNSGTATITANAGGSLVASYGFGGNANDASGNGNNGTAIGGVTYVNSMTRPAANFDGSTGYIYVPDSPSLSLNSFTLAAWINPSSIGGGNRIVEKGNSESYYLYLSSDGNPLVGFYDGAYHDVLSPAVLQTNTWCFIAGTYDGSTLKLYVNGDPVNSVELSSTSPMQTSDPLIIGWKFNGIVDDHFSGLIREVRVYNYALTQLEVIHLALRITAASVRKKKLFIFGDGFDIGAKILLNGELQKTRNDDQNPTTKLIGKKSGKNIARGQTVFLQVKNSDDRVSEEFSFTRPP
jgi:PKD repeat protein